MKRRNFLKYTAALTPLMINGVSLRAFSSPNLADCAEVRDRTLVLIQLAGGNDGVNTFIPIDQYSTYANLRPTIAIPDSGASKYIDLDTTLAVEDQIGLHPTMTDFKTMYDNGKVNIVQGVGYQNHNRSHFKSTDLWLSGGDSTPDNFNIPTGWMGRYLTEAYPGVAGKSTPKMPDPLAIELGGRKPSLGFHTETQHRSSINLSGQDPAGFFNLVSEVGGEPLANVPNTHYGDLVQHVMNIETSMSAYAQRITSVFNKGTNVATYPNHSLANQLKTVARLLSGGSKTKMFLVKIGGFDTHNDQVDQGDATTGWHATLLNRISTAVKAFQDDLGALGIEDKVLTVTFSEFGRKPLENGNSGTDHGNWAPMMIFGKHVAPGVVGGHLNLSNLNTQGIYKDDANYDYRQVFASILQDWLGASDHILNQTYFDPATYGKLPIINPNKVAALNCGESFNVLTNTEGVDARVRGLSAFPNPATTYFSLELNSNIDYDAEVRIIDMSGLLIYSENINVTLGYNQHTIDIESVPSGNYLVQVSSNGEQLGKVLKVTKV